MKKMSKILCSVLVMCGAFSMSAMSVYATGDILIDEPLEMEEAVTTVVSSEVLESGELPIITEDKVIEYPTPEVNVIEKNDDNEENAETTIDQDSEAPTLRLPEGNATIIEDVSADVVERQFIAIQSKNGNTFYIVIDKDSKDKENVYFMNLVDEYDMLAFAEDFPEGVTVETPDGEQVEPVTDADGNVIENPDDTSEGEKEDKTEKTENEGGGNNTLLILVGVFALAGGGAFYYFKVYKTKPKAPKQSITNPKKKEKFYDKHYGEITLFKTAKTFYDNKLSGAKITPKAWQKELDELKKSAEVDRAKVEKLGDDVAVMETLIYNVQRLTNYEEKQNEIQRRRTAELE